MFSRLRAINRRQAGFTLIELIISVAITGLISGGIAFAIMQVFSINSNASNQMTALREVQRAGYYISSDAEMAKSINIGDNPETLHKVEFVSINWSDWDGIDYQAEYTLNPESRELRRSYYKDGVLIYEDSLIARYIDTDPEKTNCQLDSNRLIFTVTAYIEGFEDASETRVYEITPRPSI